MVFFSSKIKKQKLCAKVLNSSCKCSILVMCKSNVMKLPTTCEQARGFIWRLINLQIVFPLLPSGKLALCALHILNNWSSLESITFILKKWHFREVLNSLCTYHYLWQKSSMWNSAMVSFKFNFNWQINKCGSLACSSVVTYSSGTAAVSLLPVVFFFCTELPSF